MITVSGQSVGNVVGVGGLTGLLPNPYPQADFSSRVSAQFLVQ